jgi:hypothetical protein
MDMDMGGGSMPTGGLNASGIDFSNETQANMFLGEILDDSVFMVEANMYARDFWWGVCALIAAFGFFNIVQKGTEIARYVKRWIALL